MSKQLSFLLFVFLFFLTVNSALANNPNLPLTIRAVSEDSSEAAAAIAELRVLGPAGLQTLLEANRTEIDRHIADPTLKSTPEWLRITTALDGVSQQKDSYLSGLYWYTDISEARKAATAAGKPILSLRLLGKLTDELSCANSRFFRTVLYSNATVAQSLRDRFVLHWESVRPVPIITIDFGDGRKLQRTITGNSIHYILDNDGRLLDALPGLYGPPAFLRGLSEAETLFQQVRTAEPQRRLDRKSTRLNSSHLGISYAVFCLKKKTLMTSCRIGAGRCAVGRSSSPVARCRSNPSNSTSIRGSATIERQGSRSPMAACWSLTMSDVSGLLRSTCSIDRCCLSRASLTI